MVLVCTLGSEDDSARLVGRIGAMKVLAEEEEVEEEEVVVDSVEVEVVVVVEEDVRVEESEEEEDEAEVVSEAGHSLGPHARSVRQQPPPRDTGHARKPLEQASVVWGAVLTPAAVLVVTEVDSSSVMEAAVDELGADDDDVDGRDNVVVTVGVTTTTAVSEGPGPPNFMGKKKSALLRIQKSGMICPLPSWHNIITYIHLPRIHKAVYNNRLPTRLHTPYNPNHNCPPNRSNLRPSDSTRPLRSQHSARLDRSLPRRNSYQVARRQSSRWFPKGIGKHVFGALSAQLLANGAEPKRRRIRRV